MLECQFHPLFWFLLPLYFPTIFFTRCLYLWKTATRAAVVALEDQKAYWSEKCNSLAEDAGVLDKYTAVTWLGWQISVQSHLVKRFTVVVPHILQLTAVVKQFSQWRCKDWRFYYAGKSLVEVCPKSGKLLLRRASNLAVLDRQVSFSRLVMDVRWYGSVVIVQRLKIRHLAADDAILVLRDINTTLCHYTLTQDFCQSANTSFTMHSRDRSFGLLGRASSPITG